MKYMVISQDKAHNYPLYYVHSNLDSFIIYNDEGIDEQVTQEENDIDKKQENHTLIVQQNSETEPFWNIIFDGPFRKASSGESVWVSNSGNNHAERHSYKLNFHCTNNIVEYEVLLLGLELLKKLCAKIIVVHGDSELIVRQIKGEYAAKHPRLRAYRNVVLDFLGTFKEYDLVVIPKNNNVLANVYLFQLAHVKCLITKNNIQWRLNTIQLYLTI